MEKNFGRGFGNGLGNFPQGSQEYQAIKREIMSLLGLTTTISFNKYRWGEMFLRVDDARKIEKIFKKYGIDHCWNQAFSQSINR